MWQTCNSLYNWSQGVKVLLKSKESIDQELEKVISAIQEATKTIPSTQPSKYTWLGWSPRCSELVKEAKKACRKFNKQRTEENFKTMRHAISSKNKEIHRERGKEFQRFISKATQADNSFWNLT